MTQGTILYGDMEVDFESGKIGAEITDLVAESVRQKWGEEQLFLALSDRLSEIRATFGHALAIEACICALLAWRKKLAANEP